MENKLEIGFGIAGFTLSLTLLTILIKNQVITIENAKRAISLAHTFSENPEFFPGDPQILQASDAALRIAESALQALVNQESPEVWM